jgi:hypothetical protein
MGRSRHPGATPDYDEQLMEFLLVVAGGLVSLVTALALSIFQRRLDEAGHRADRIREYNLQRIDDTRRQLIGMLDGIAAALDKDTDRSRRLLEAANDQLFANARLVGDLDALTSAAHALVLIQEPIAEGKVRKAVQLAFTNPWNDRHRDALHAARSSILSALDLQHERVLKDQELRVLTVEEIRSVPELVDPQGAVAAAKAAQPATPSPPTAPNPSK